MKKFKVEKSRTTLWREAKKVALPQADSDDLDLVEDDIEFNESCTVPQPYSDDLGLAEDDTEFSELCMLSEPGVDGELSDADVGRSEECQMSDDNVSALDFELSFENSVGSRWRWLYDDDGDSELGDKLVRDLAMWCTKNDITMTATASLLTILKPHLPFLPKSAQTLRNTLRDTSHLMKTISGGEYCHLGLSNCLTHLIRQNHITNDHLELQINVDGIPLFKSSSVSLWPILCLVRNIPFRVPFVVGMFCGKEKPGSASEFLSDFVEEACMLVKHGLTFEQKNRKVIIHSFVCDAPARAYVKGIKSPSGYSSCEKCTVHGEYYGKVIFPVANCPLRTDEAFDAMTDEDHHISPCPLKPLPIGYVTQFGLDYMHLACLGVMRRLILYWKGPNGPLHVRLGRKLICDLSSHLLYLSQFVPVEFARKPRSLDEVLRWKATEFREFMLYSGPVVLQDILGDDLYDHFMLLFVSIRILVSRQLSLQYCDYAHELLIKFVSDAQVLYGKDILVYNVHCLIHLSNDVKRLGCLEDFSAFVFENKLGQLKKLVHKPQQPLQQIMRRLHEETFLDFSENNVTLEPTLICEHHDGPMHGFRGTQYKRVQANRFTVCVNTGLTGNNNNCILIDGCIPAILKNIVKTDKDITLLCEQFGSVQNAFEFPLSSSQLNIFKVCGRRCRQIFPVSLSDVICKCVCWPVFDRDSLVAEDNTFWIIPLLH